MMLCGLQYLASIATAACDPEHVLPCLACQRPLCLLTWLHCMVLFSHNHGAVLCCAVLRCAVLCCAVLCRAVLCRA